jgi:hypothetical protein
LRCSRARLAIVPPVGAPGYMPLCDAPGYLYVLEKRGW